MLLLVGLGNPDSKYQGNRHNIGFQVIDTVADHYGFGPEKKKFQGLVRDGVLEGHGTRQKALLLKPGTYYNESGNSVREAAKFYKIPAESIVVFHDELDLAPGKLKARKGGSAAGNNGIKSIISHIGSDFIRVRIGIGHPGDKKKVTSHVLSDFSSTERDTWVDALKVACAQNLPLLTPEQNGIDRFMSAVSHSLQPERPKAEAAKPRESTQGTDEQPDASPAAAAAEAEAQPGPFAKLKALFNQD